ncbi:hypothetical protein [Salinicoccus carnicancri]|uniref:hypothetical protein n=1 Tax=Salinicoccus carnicancri TaxID=558170 RepID=UPI0002D40085|nr:hypothetical protein [Salinicoccus carnicancri]
MTQAGRFLVLQVLKASGHPGGIILNSRHFAISFKVHYESGAWISPDRPALYPGVPLFFIVLCQVVFIYPIML